MPRHTPTAFLFIVGLLFVDTTHADELISSDVVFSSTQPISFIIDFDSASLEKRQAHGVDLDAVGIFAARDAADAALPRERGKVKRNWLILFDSAIFESGFFDAPLLVEIPTGQSCIAHPQRIIKTKDGSITWMGRCESSIASEDKIVLGVYPEKQLVVGNIRWGGRYFTIDITRKKPFHVIYELNRDYVPEKLPVF